MILAAAVSSAKKVSGGRVLWLVGRGVGHRNLGGLFLGAVSAAGFWSAKLGHSPTSIL